MNASATVDRAKFQRQCEFVYAYLNQTEWWLPKPPRRPIHVADMDPQWRHNAARWLERRAVAWELEYSLGEIYALGSSFEFMGDSVRDGFEEAQDQRRLDPLAWIRTTTLHRALLDGAT